jgi:autotransporter-associated beta strand protein
VRPNGAGQTAVFNVATSGSLAITLDAPQTVGSLAFGNSASNTTGYILSSTSANTKLTLNNNGGGATITVTDGQHAINAPVILADNLTVSSDDDSSWTLTFGTAGGITESGHKQLTLDALHGKLILSGTDSFSGGTFVASGTLVVTRAAALADRSNLTIGNASLFAHEAIVPTLAPTAVPEPGALAIVATAIVLIGLHRKARRVR